MNTKFTYCVLVWAIGFLICSCDWKIEQPLSIPDASAQSNDTDTNTDTGFDTDDSIDAGGDTDTDTDTDTAEDGGTCGDDTDSEGTCGGDADADADTDTDTDSDTSVDGGIDTDTVKWDGGVGDYPDFCKNPAYAVYTTPGEYDFNNIGAPYLGKADSSEVVINGFSSFYCGHCQTAGQMFGEILKNEAYASRAVFYFGHFVWSDEVGSSWDAHRGTHAAHQQGKFWQMHDAVFNSTESAYGDVVTDLADQIGLDMVRYHADFNSNETIDYIIADRNEASDAGVTGTPTIYLNGTKVSPWVETKNILDCLFGYETDPIPEGK